MTATMRQQMVRTVSDLLKDDQRLVLLLASVSTDLFKPVAQKIPERVINIGIMEQAMTSVAAGMALEGFIPVLHTIAPFLVERAFEQIKDDFCYQRLGGNFISIGASYDYSTEGMTHHAPGDVQILRSLPSMQIVVPGTAAEFDELFRDSYANGAPTYFRLSELSNPVSHPARFGKMTVMRHGEQATVIAIGPALAYTLPAIEGLDVTLLYCTTVAPFDAETLRGVHRSQKVILVEPYYDGVLAQDVYRALQSIPIMLESIGVPHEVPTHYGTPEQHNAANGLTPQNVRYRIEMFL